MNVKILRKGIPLLVVALVLVTLAGPAQAVDKIYTFKVTFDTTFISTAAVISQPYVLIQNSKDSGGAMTVDAVKLQWNDEDDLTTLEDGIYKHDGEDDCTPLQTETLNAGEGLTIFVPLALTECPEFPDCPDSCIPDCGNDCHEMYMQTPWGEICTCVPNWDTGTTPAPSRVTVVVEVDNESNGVPIARAFEYHVENAGTSSPDILGISSAYVTRVITDE